MPTPTDISNMQAALDKLNSAQLTAQAATSGTWTSIGTALLGDSSSQDANAYALTKTEASIEQLDGEFWDQVVAGTRTPDNWLAIASETYKTIQSVDADLDNWTFGGVASATTTATVADVKKDAAIGLAIGTPLVLIAVALIFLFEFGPLLLAGRNAAS